MRRALRRALTALLDALFAQCAWYRRRGGEWVRVISEPEMTTEWDVAAPRAEWRRLR